MSTSQYALNLGLLGWILWANLGTRAATRARLLLPLLVVAGVAAGFLTSIPTRGNDVLLEVLLTAAGALLGMLAGLLVQVQQTRSGDVVMRAGVAFAALWVVVIGGRIAFAYGAEHWFGPAIGRFSRTHEITGADAWTAAFVLMALAMVLGRVAVSAWRVARVSRGTAAVLA